MGRDETTETIESRLYDNSEEGTYHPTIPEDEIYGHDEVRVKQLIIGKERE